MNNKNYNFKNKFQKLYNCKDLDILWNNSYRALCNFFLHTQQCSTNMPLENLTKLCHVPVLTHFLWYAQEWAAYSTGVGLTNLMFYQSRSAMSAVSLRRGFFWHDGWILEVCNMKRDGAQDTRPVAYELIALFMRFLWRQNVEGNMHPYDKPDDRTLWKRPGFFHVSAP